MKVVVDENIPFGAEAFAAAGPVVRLPGREISKNDLLDAHVLIVRSITKVGPALLEGTGVRFVGTCTIGTDHLDIPWLQSQSIQWASAPGCNARSVAEWTLSALACGHLKGRLDLGRIRQAGIIGVGNVGQAVQNLLETIGWEVLRSDPPRAAREGAAGFHSLESVLSAPVVLSHLPLESSGPWPTARLLADNLRQLPHGAAFINAGRGATVSTPALTELAAQRPDVFVALDVFDPEPAFPVDLAKCADLISPHVAGYSLEGKIEGTRMVREALGQFLNIPSWQAPEPEPAPLDASTLRLHDSRPVTPATDPWDALASLLVAAHDPSRDDAALREGLTLSDNERGGHFDRLRKGYPIRLEWQHRPVVLPRTLPLPTWELAQRLGFREM
ncbi:MAG: 4-phosphoerythronate dehydrogenase [Fibrobacteres bacterium]|nr:4-phosphoerythronate dehydrogenase [Fibrobacterota bacterium]